jgi:hypothetical protein
MKAINVKFNDGSNEERQFNECKEMYDKFQKCVAKQIDCSNPQEIVEHLTEISAMLAMGAVCKATLEYLTDKLSTKALMNLKDEEGSANERKVMLAFAIGDCSFYNHVMELLIKELHYKIEILRTSLSYCKSELALS